MKKTIFAIGLFIASISFGQDIQIPSTLGILETEMNLNSSNQNGFRANTSGENKDILKELSSYLNKAYELKTKVRSGQLLGEELVHSSISSKTFGLVAYVQETSEGKELRLFMNFETDVYANSAEYPHESDQAKLILKNFSKTYFKEFAENEINSKTKEVGKLGKDLAKLNKNIAKEEKAKAKAEKTIAKLQSKIRKTEEKIVKAQNSVAEMKNDSKEQTSEIEKIDVNHKTLSTEKENTSKKLQEKNKELDILKSNLSKIAQY